MILICDDGKRENEVDLVFHANFAETKSINTAITHAKGLLCVSVDSSITDKLHLLSASKYPNEGFKHTHFTISVDARNDIKSGISAKDRSVTIKKLESSKSTAQDFVSPGHVFPVSALSGGVFERPGHTEACLEMSRISKLSNCTVMCEILDESGNSLSPIKIKKSKHFLKKLNMISTIDIFWQRIFFYDDFKIEKQKQGIFILDAANNYRIPYTSILRVNNKNNKSLNISLSDGFQSFPISNQSETSQFEIVIFIPEGFQKKDFTKIPEMEKSCDLSQREGVAITSKFMKVLVSQISLIRFLRKNYGIKKFQSLETINSAFEEVIHYLKLH
jgi:3,4-dihydroxy-2-butanone 4-phosphate synthase